MCVDMPQGFDSSVPPVTAATADDLAMVRFHGRDTEGVEGEVRNRQPSASATTTPRRSWGVGTQDRSLAAQARETHVLMNNCYRDFAVRNARELGDLLGVQVGLEPQESLVEN